MSNAIDLIVGKQAIEGLNEMIAKLGIADKAMLELSQKVINTSPIKDVKTPAGLDAYIQANAKLTAELAKQASTSAYLQSQIDKLAATNGKLAQSQAKGATSAGNQTKGTREQAVATQILRAETDRNIRANTLLAGAYAKASAQLLVLKKEAKDAAITFGEESKQAKAAGAAALEMDGRIKAADKSVGDFQRNVGNYSGGIVSGFQKVFSQVRQLAYILPGIGIGGIFALALDPLFELIKGLDIFKTKLDLISRSLTDFRKSFGEANVGLQKDVQNFKELAAIAADAALPYRVRKKAIEDLKKAAWYVQREIAKREKGKECAK